MKDRISSPTRLWPLENPLIPNSSSVHYMIPIFCYRIFRVRTVLKRKCMRRWKNSQALISAIVTETAVLEDNKTRSETSPRMPLSSLAFCWTQTNERPESHIQNTSQIWVWLFEELFQLELRLFIKTTFGRRQLLNPEDKKLAQQVVNSYVSENSKLEKTSQLQFSVFFFFWKP